MVLRTLYIRQETNHMLRLLSQRLCISGDELVVSLLKKGLEPLKGLDLTKEDASDLAEVLDIFSE